MRLSRHLVNSQPMAAEGRDKTPKPGTRRRSLFDLLVSRPGEWIDFDPKTLGYASPRSNILKADIRALRETYDLEIQTAAQGHPGTCRWRYVPR
jgi:hypothetical protein